MGGGFVVRVCLSVLYFRLEFLVVCSWFVVLNVRECFGLDFTVRVCCVSLILVGRASVVCCYASSWISAGVSVYVLVRAS